MIPINLSLLLIHSTLIGKFVHTFDVNSIKIDANICFPKKKFPKISTFAFVEESFCYQ